MLLLRSDEPQLLGQVPIVFVAETLNKILAWVLLKVPEATVFPSHYVRNKDPFVLACPHKLSVILELATEGLKQAIIKMMEKAAS